MFQKNNKITHFIAKHHGNFEREFINFFKNLLLNISKDVKLLFFIQSLGFQLIRHFHAPRCPRKKQKQATLLEFQYKSIRKMLLLAQKLAFFLKKLLNQAALLVKNF